MRRKLSALLIALVAGTGLVIAAENSHSESSSSGGIGPEPKHVTGAAQAGAGPTGSGGTGMSATGAGAAQGGAKGGANKGEANVGEVDRSGSAYVDCPGNAFSGGIRNDPSGTECVPPESVVIEGSDNLRRDNSTAGHAVGDTSGAGNSSGGGNAATGSASNQPNEASAGNSGTGATGSATGSPNGSPGSSSGGSGGGSDGRSGSGS